MELNGLVILLFLLVTTLSVAGYVYLKLSRYHQAWAAEESAIAALESRGGFVSGLHAPHQTRRMDILAMLTRNRRLERVEGITFCAQCDDATVKEICAANRLPIEGVTIDECAVSDTAMIYLADLAALREVVVKNGRITTAGIESLAGARSLIGLQLYGSQFDNATIGACIPMVNLRSLSLAHTSVSDDGLTQLPGLPSLKWLDLSDTRISDHGLGHLKKLRGLQGLWLFRTRITSPAAKDLKMALPTCEVNWEPVEAIYAEIGLARTLRHLDGRR